MKIALLLALALPAVAQTGPLFVFGDSWSTGTGASDYAHSYPGILTNSHRGQTIPAGVYGGVSRVISVGVANTINPTAADPLYEAVIEIGINDASCGTAANCVSNYVNSQAASFALFELTHTKYQSAACTLSANWTHDTTTFPLYPAVATTVSGSTATCTITTSGNGIALEYVALDGGTGAATMAVDGGTPITISFAATAVGGGLPYTLYRSQEIPASAGPHTVTITTTSSGQVEFLALDSYPTNSVTTLPRLTVTTVPPISGQDDAGTRAMNAALLPLVNSVIAEGANVVLADIRTPLLNGYLYGDGATYTDANGIVQTCKGYGSGGLHPNDCGHLVVAQAIMAASPTYFSPNVAPRGLGQQTGPFRANAGVAPLAMQVAGSGQSTGNANNYFNFGGISPGGWCWLYNDCFEPGALPSYTILGPYQDIHNGQPILWLNIPGQPICLNQFNGPNNDGIITKQDDFGPPTRCWTPNGDMYGFTKDRVGNVFASYDHVGHTSRDNVGNALGSGYLSPVYDLWFVGPGLTSAPTYTLPTCNSTYSAATNQEVHFVRHGTDGYPVTFQSAGGDNINGGAVGNTYVWNSTEGDSLTALCQANKYAGSNWSLYH